MYYIYIILIYLYIYKVRIKEVEEAFEKGIHKIGDKTDAVFSHIAGTDIRLTQMAKREFVAPVARTFEDLRCVSICSFVLAQQAKREFVAPVARTFEDLRCVSYLIINLV